MPSQVCVCACILHADSGLRSQAVARAAHWIPLEPDHLWWHHWSLVPVYQVKKKRDKSTTQMTHNNQRTIVKSCLIKSIMTGGKFQKHPSCNKIISHYFIFQRLNNRFFFITAVNYWITFTSLYSSLGWVRRGTQHSLTFCCPTRVGKYHYKIIQWVAWW